MFGSIVAVTYLGRPLVGVIDHPRLDVRCTGAFGLGARCNGDSLNMRDVVERADEAVGTISRILR